MSSSGRLEGRVRDSRGCKGQSRAGSVLCVRVLTGGLWDVWSGQPGHESRGGPRYNGEMRQGSDGGTERRGELQKW